LLRWLERCGANPMMEKETKMIEIITIPMEGAAVLANAILAAEVVEDVEEAVVDARGRGNNSEHLKNVEYFNCGKNGHNSTDCSLPRKNDNEQSNMVSKADLRKLF
jgi:hypothetical protein